MAGQNTEGRETPWWEKLGFGSLDEFWESQRPRRRRNRNRIPGPALPEASRPDRRRSARSRTSQVNVKLTASDHADLKRAAELYGVAPATMAQLLVNRGVRAVLDGE